MPVPKPRADEDKNQFVSRCMGDEKMVTDFPNAQQRVAVCYSSWNQSQRKSNVTLETQNETRR